MIQDEAFMKALSEFERPQPATAVGVADVCKTYAKVKPILQGILPFLALIPRVGKPTSVAITALMAALDSFCPTS